MKTMKAMKTILTLDTALTALVGVLFMFFCFTGSRWIARVEQLEQDHQKTVAKLETLQAVEDARWNEVLRRLGTIDDSLRELRK